MENIISIAERYGLFVLEDAAHAVENSFNNKKDEYLEHAIAFSFYANKNITSAGEGGALATSNKKLAHKIHPDKKTGNQGDFAELKKSVDDNDVEKIIDLATDYGIDINEDIDSVDFYESRIDELKGKIQHFSKTVVMQWWNMNDADRKKYESTFIKVLRDG